MRNVAIKERPMGDITAALDIRVIALILVVAMPVPQILSWPDNVYIAANRTVVE